MKQPFDTLTTRGQIRRYHRLAWQALEQYPLHVTKIRCITARYNVIFRVDAAEGVFVLRISSTNHRTRLQIQSEMQWLAAICADSDLRVACPIHSKQGGLVVTVEHESVPHARHIVVSRWLYGKLLKENPTESIIRQLGQAVAKLHQHSEHYVPNGEFMDFDYYGVDEWGDLDYLEQNTHPLITPEQQKLFKQSIVQSSDTIQRLQAQGRHLIHYDLHLSNSLIYRNNIGVFDFDDCRWGHFAQDLAPALYWLISNPPLAEAFLKGYTDIRPMPCSQTELRQVLNHRAMYSINFIMHYRATMLSSERIIGYINQAEATIRNGF